MNILIVYATYSSGTETAANIVKKQLEESNHTVTLIKAVDTKTSDLTGYDLVIIGSPSWWVNEKDGQPHIQMGELLAKSSDTSLSNKRFAIFGLGDSTYAHFCGAVNEIEQFIQKQGGTKVTDSLRIDSFYFAEEQNTKLLRDWVENLKTHL